jgi:hypothetical protein
MPVLRNSNIMYSQSSASLYNNNSIHCSKVPGNMASEEEGKVDIKINKFIWCGDPIYI